MSYYVELISLASIKKESIKRVREELACIPPYESDGLRMLLSVLAIREDGYVCFQSTGHPFWSDNALDEEDGFVDSLNAPWRDVENIAQWLALHANKDSKIIFHSLEMDGVDFAYIFDGEGRYRYLEYRPVEKWKTAKQQKIVLPAPKRERARKERIKEVKEHLLFTEAEKKERQTMINKTTKPVVNYLSIRQPMAWAIIAGHKDIENREWPTNIRGRILIHAGKSTQWFDDYCAFIRKKGVKKIPSKEDLDFGVIIGSVEIVDCVEKHKSKWYDEDFYGFVLAKPKKLKKPIPMRANAKMQRVPDDVLKKLKRLNPGFL